MIYSVKIETNMKSNTSSNLTTSFVLFFWQTSFQHYFKLKTLFDFFSWKLQIHLSQKQKKTAVYIIYEIYGILKINSYLDL